MLWMLLGCWGKQFTEELAECVTEEHPSESFVLLPEEELIQIHADTASDGSLTWVVYNLPNDSNQFETHLLALGCGGEAVWGPELVMADPGVNQTTPRVAVSGDRVLVASQGDSGEAPFNLSIRLHIQTRDGELIDSRIWDPTIGTTTEGNRWLPSVVGTEDGFWIAAAVGRDTHFQTAVQALDQDGQPAANPHWVGPDAYAVFPNIDVSGERYAVAWETGDDSVQWVEGTVAGPDTEVQTIENSGAPRVLWGSDGLGIFSHQLSPTIVQLDGENLSGSASTHTPNAARGAETSMFVHYRIQGGTANDLFYGQLSASGTLIDQPLASDPPAAPYRPAITHVSQDSYFVVWSEGENPDFQLRAQFVSLAP